MAEEAEVGLGRTQVSRLPKSRAVAVERIAFVVPDVVPDVVVAELDGVALVSIQ
jgi:hypothetical protein